MGDRVSSLVPDHPNTRSPYVTPPPSSRLVDDEAAAVGPVVDEATGDAELGRDLGEIIGSIPAGLGQLTIAEGDFATQVTWRGSQS